MTRRESWKIWLAVVCVFGCGRCSAVQVYPLVVFNGDDCSVISYLNLYVEVSDAGAGVIDFAFHNDSTAASSIARIYFDDDAAVLASILSIDGAGSLFEPEASPHNLPAGRSLSPMFEATEQFSIGAVPPAPFNGINPGEYSTVSLGLSAGAMFADVVSALDTGMLRAGAHIIALPNGESFSAVTVPEPASLMLLGLGVSAVAGATRSLTRGKRESRHNSIREGKI